jgi:Asp-tRNA(Asn)/Glu-tRNA(Gln) amidotransferase A subunit family amidase
MTTIDITDDNLCFLSAQEAVSAFREGSLSPVELARAVIARCEDVQPKINAFCGSFFDRALEMARAAERAYAKGGKPRPLEGVLLTVKDFHPIENEITTYGSKVFVNHRPDYTAPYVDRLLKAGAILLARSTTPEFAHSGRTSSPLWGITSNPWNLDYSPGGSSGGSAAAVAAGMTTIADGTDGGGSIRIPASACGVVGYKPPFGRNPTDSEHPFETLLHYGPITRTVADAVLMQNLTSGPHVSDPTSLRDRVIIPDIHPSLAGSRIALSLDLGFFHVDPEVRKNTLEAADVFRDLGCVVEEVSVGWDWDVFKTWSSRWAVMLASLCGDLMPKFENDLDPNVVTNIRKGLATGAVDYYRNNIVLGHMYKTIGPLLSKYSVLICPTLAVPSVTHGENFKDYKIDGKKIPISGGGWSMTSPFNLLSQCPVMSVPTGFSTIGIPTGMQIVGPTYDDLAVFRFASAFEKARPWNARRPQFTTQALA